MNPAWNRSTKFGRSLRAYHVLRCQYHKPSSSSCYVHSSFWHVHIFPKYGSCGSTRSHKNATTWPHCPGWMENVCCHRQLPSSQLGCWDGFKKHSRSGPNWWKIDIPVVYRYFLQGLELFSSCQVNIVVCLSVISLLVYFLMRRNKIASAKPINVGCTVYYIWSQSVVMRKIIVDQYDRYRISTDQYTYILSPDAFDFSPGYQDWRSGSSCTDARLEHLGEGWPKKPSETSANQSVLMPDSNHVWFHPEVPNIY